MDEPICLNGPHCRHPFCPEHAPVLVNTVEVPLEELKEQFPEHSEWFDLTNNAMDLPVMGERVIVRLRDGSELVGAILQGDMDWWWREKFFDHSEVTHWRWL